MCLNLSATAPNSCTLDALSALPLRNASKVSLLISNRPASGAARLSILSISRISCFTSPVSTFSEGAETVSPVVTAVVPAVPAASSKISPAEPAEELPEVSVAELPENVFHRKNMAIANMSHIQNNMSSLSLIAECARAHI